MEPKNPTKTAKELANDFVNRKPILFPPTFQLDKEKKTAKSREGDFELFQDLWKNKETISNYLTMGRFLKIILPSLTLFAGFLIKSKWVKKIIVKRYVVSPKNFYLQTNSFLGYIQRSNILSIWDKEMEYDEGETPFILVEGHQGAGKSFLAQKYVEEKSKSRPAIYISLREIEPSNWRQIIAKQIHLYPEVLPKPQSTKFEIKI